MELASYLTQERVVLFLMIFVRFSSLFAFIPFFNSMAVSMQIKASLAFFMSVLFFIILDGTKLPLDFTSIMLGIIGEATFGFIVGFFLSVLLGYFSSAGEHISMVMGFSMASTIDPQTMQSSQVLSQFLNSFVLMIFLAIDGHHTVINFIANSMTSLPLGGFMLAQSQFIYAVEAVKHLFMMGFVLAFPIIALSILSDIIFGMIMKTMPSFNLLVVGFPVKIVVSITVLMAILGSFAYIFKREFFLMMNLLQKLFS
jgi:flagellar biosynthetic protein FliR